MVLQATFGTIHASMMRPSQSQTAALSVCLCPSVCASRAPDLLETGKP